MGEKAKQVAVVTGGARRIGRAIAKHLHGLGFDIALHYRSSEDSAQALADALCIERADSCRLFQADLREQDRVAALAEEVLTHYASIDLLVNNASEYSPSVVAASPIEQTAIGLSSPTFSAIPNFSLYCMPIATPVIGMACIPVAED